MSKTRYIKTIRYYSSIICVSIVIESGFPLVKSLSIVFEDYFNQPFNNIPDKAKLYLNKIPSKITRNYTLCRINKSNLEKIVDNKKKEIYKSKINNKEYYMVDIEITKPEINKEKIMELINQLKYELQIS